MKTRTCSRAVVVATAVLATACSQTVAGDEAVDDVSIVICPDASADRTCKYSGLTGLQAAIDEAQQGTELRLLKGDYLASDYRDVPFQDLHVRGALVIDGKDLSIFADEGAVIRGQDDFPVSAIVIRRSMVTIEGLRIADFGYDEPEDDIYDGHGIFTIGSDVRLERVQIEGVDKMALTGRDDGKIVAHQLDIVQSHLGIWLEETASADIKNSRISGSDSAALAIYGNASVTIRDSEIDSNEDDGLYTEDQARIVSLDNALRNNTPFGARAAGESRIVICRGEMSGNAADIGQEGSGRVVIDDAEVCASS
jgi:nitrous oxidase accessory protein NosD